MRFFCFRIVDSLRPILCLPLPVSLRYARSADLFSGGVAVRGPAWFWGEFLAMPVRSVNGVKCEIGEIKGCFLAMVASKSGIGAGFFRHFD